MVASQKSESGTVRRAPRFGRGRGTGPQPAGAARAECGRAVAVRRPRRGGRRVVDGTGARLGAESDRPGRGLLAICAGLHALAQRRSWRRGLLRPFHAGASVPSASSPCSVRLSPASRSWKYSCSGSFAASLAVSGWRAADSAFHWAMPTRYPSFPPRVAVLCLSSREIVDAELPSLRAISRTATFCAASGAISSRSANERYLPENGPKPINGMPSRSRNRREPATAGTPPATVAPRRAHRRTSRHLRHPARRPSHPAPPRSRCCNDPFNP